MTGAPVWVGWVITILCLSFLFAACIIYIRQVQPNFSNLCFQHQAVDKSFYLTGTAKGMEVPFCTPAYFFTGLPGGNRQYLLLLQKQLQSVEGERSWLLSAGSSIAPKQGHLLPLSPTGGSGMLAWSGRQERIGTD